MRLQQEMVWIALGSDPSKEQWREEGVKLGHFESVMGLPSRSLGKGGSCGVVLESVVVTAGDFETSVLSSFEGIVEVLAGVD